MEACGAVVLLVVLFGALDLLGSFFVSIASQLSFQNTVFSLRLYWYSLLVLLWDWRF